MVTEKDPVSHEQERHTQFLNIALPLMGEGITEATFIKSLKKVGEAVKKDEPLFEVSTDKVDTEIPSPAEGVIDQIVAKEGASVAVSSTVIILRIATDSGGQVVGRTQPSHPTTPSAIPPPQKSSLPTQAAQKASVLSTPLAPSDLKAETKLDQKIPPKDELHEAPAMGGKPLASNPQVFDRTAHQVASPLVRKVAQERHIDLSKVQGSGLNGRIILRDLDDIPPNNTTYVAGPSSPVSLAEHGALETKVVNGIETLEGVPVRREKMSKIRGLIAEHMVRSVRTSPHVTTVFEIDMHKVFTLRESSFEAIKQSEQVNLTYTAFFAFAAAQTIKKFPIVNVSVDRDQILWKDAINLGIAVAIDSGLIVPVIKNAGDLNLIGVARQIQNLAQKARNKKLNPEDVQGGTFSITNPGMFGSLVSAPIINQPQVAILSIGAIVKRPVVLSIPFDDNGRSSPSASASGHSRRKKIDDIIAIRPMVQVGLTFDHRVIDGEGGAKFLAHFKDILENFSDSSLS